MNDARAVGITSRQQACPRRRANRADIKPGELNAITRELIQMRRPDLGIPVQAEISKALIVGHDQDNIGPRLGRERRRQQGSDGGEERGGKAHRAKHVRRNAISSPLTIPADT